MYPNTLRIITPFRTHTHTEREREKEEWMTTVYFAATIIFNEIYFDQEFAAQPLISKGGKVTEKKKPCVSFLFSGPKFSFAPKRRYSDPHHFILCAVTMVFCKIYFALHIDKINLACWKWWYFNSIYSIYTLRMYYFVHSVYNREWNKFNPSVCILVRALLLDKNHKTHTHTRARTHNNLISQK